MALDGIQDLPSGIAGTLVQGNARPKFLRHAEARQGVFRRQRLAEHTQDVQRCFQARGEPGRAVDRLGRNL